MNSRSVQKRQILCKTTWRNFT